MKNILTFFLSFLVLQAAAQLPKLQGAWLLTHIADEQGNRLRGPQVDDIRMEFNFLSPDSLLATLNGKSSVIPYKFKDSVLTYRVARLKLLEYQPTRLVLRQILVGADNEATVLRLTFRNKTAMMLGRQPQFYTARSGQRVYITEEPLINPYFMDENRSAMDFIYQKFGFPEWRKGKFVVRFVVTATGEMTGVKVLESSHPRFEGRLLSAVAQTKGRWLPAVWEGRPVATENVLTFNLDFMTEEQVKPLYDRDESAFLTDMGREQLAARKHKLAIGSLTEALEKDTQNLEALTLRAQAYLVIGEVKNACGDWEKLILLDQITAKKPFVDNKCPEVLNKK